MAMCIEFNDSNAILVEDLLHFGDIGDQRILYGSWSNHTSYYGFIFTKCKKNLIKVYSVYRGYIHNSNLEKPVAEIRRSNLSLIHI